MNIKQMRLNLLFTGISFLISMGMNFYITPILSKNLGDAAYGFVGMANDFVSYAAIVSAVLNSVAARFIAVEVYKKNYEKANCYYSSVFIANVILSIFILIVSIIFINKMDIVFSVPVHLEKDVKITFFITFLNYIIILITSIFSICTFITNRLDIAGVRNSISYIIKFLLIFLMFSYTKIHMYQVAIATIISSLLLAVTNIKLTKRLLPQLTFSLKKFKVSYIKCLALSGIWMAISNLSQVLMTGLDSIITNKMIGAEEMGILNISRTIPNAIILAISTIGVIFTPNFVELYAKGKSKELIGACKQSIYTMGLVLGVPTIGVIAFGNQFYSLWLPYKTSSEIEVIQVLSVLMMMQSVFNMLTISIAQLSVVTNKLKTPVFVSLILGTCNIAIVIIIVKYTQLGIYAVAGVSSALFTIRYLIFNPIYAACVLKAKWYTFYPAIARSLVPLVILAIIYSWLNSVITLTSWGRFICMISLAGGAGYIFIYINTRVFYKKKFKLKESDTNAEI